MLARRVTGHAIAAAGRHAGLQVWKGCVAEGAITTMGDIDRCIRGAARIMTAGAACSVEILNPADSHIAASDMVCMGYRSV